MFVLSRLHYTWASQQQWRHGPIWLRISSAAVDHLADVAMSQNPGIVIELVNGGLFSLFMFIPLNMSQNPSSSKPAAIPSAKPSHPLRFSGPVARGPNIDGHLKDWAIGVCTWTSICASIMQNIWDTSAVSPVSCVKLLWKAHPCKSTTAGRMQ